MSNTVTVRRPELTAEERARRMAQIKAATTALVIAAEIARKKGQRHEKTA